MTQCGELRPEPRARLSFAGERRQPDILVAGIFSEAPQVGVKELTNLSLIASAYCGFYGAQTGLPLASMATLTATSIATSAIVAKAGMQHYEDKYRWVGFLQQQREKIKSRCTERS
jgi:hypothetical protein